MAVQAVKATRLFDGLGDSLFQTGPGCRGERLYEPRFALAGIGCHLAEALAGMQTLLDGFGRDPDVGRRGLQQEPPARG